MPLIQVRVIKDVFSKEQKHQIISKLTDAMVSDRRREHARRHLVCGRGGGKRRLGHRRQRADHSRRARLGAWKSCLTRDRARAAWHRTVKGGSGAPCPQFARIWKPADREGWSETAMNRSAPITADFVEGA